MKYSKEYQERHDIDWFALYEGVPIHVASNGGEIPADIDRIDNRKWQSFLSNNEPPLTNADIFVNDDWLNDLDNRLSDSNSNIEAYHFDKESYKQTFVEFARFGFVSIDNAIVNNKYQYKVVAYPIEKERLFKVINTNSPRKLPNVVLDEKLKLDLWRKE